jgi:hypothetical protein
MEQIHQPLAALGPHPCQSHHIPPPRLHSIIIINQIIIISMEFSNTVRPSISRNSTNTEECQKRHQSQFGKELLNRSDVEFYESHFCINKF